MTSNPPGTLIVAIGAATLAVLASTAALLIGPAEDYALIFPPHWITYIASALLLASIVASRSVRSRRSAGMLGWAAAVFFFGASGGVILDGFRGFFWATGIPAGDFATVDWPGAVARGTNLLAALAAVAWAWRLRARSTVGTSPRTRSWLVWSGVAFALPYPLLKLVWWARDVADRAADGHASFPTLELLSFGAALGLLLLLTARRPLPVPARLLIVGGWVASMALLSMGFLMVFGLIAQVTGLATGHVEFADGDTTLMVLCVYSTWLMLGTCVLVATLRFIDGQRSRRDQAAGRTMATTPG